MPSDQRFSAKIRLFQRELRNHGLQHALDLARNSLAFDILKAKQDSNQRRFRLSSKIAQQFNNTVGAGPFAGMKFVPNSWWSGADRGAMILGLYEQEVLEAMQHEFLDKKTFVDIGAADGYYAIGALKTGWAERSYCFEISKLGQEVIRQQSELNLVSDKVFVFGEATNNVLDVLLESTGESPNDWVVLIDIEGGEFDLLSDALLEKLVGATLIVEVHDFGQNAGRLPELISLMEKYFAVRKVSTGKRDLSQFEFLHDWPDDDRWLLCSEGRPKLMSWLIATTSR